VRFSCGLMQCASSCRSGEVFVFLSEGVTHPGEKSSPKRDNVGKPLF